MTLPNKEVIEKARDRVDRLKGKFEREAKNWFHQWQLAVHAEFMDQIRHGASITILTSELRESLSILLNNHYKAVAEGFVPGLLFEDIVRAVQLENEDDDWLILGIFSDIEKGINAQISIQQPKHEKNIIDTTETMGTMSASIARIDEADPAVVMGNKFAGRETTVSVTETAWIAESSMNTALNTTNPALAIANEAQMERIQEFSPNVSLRELDVGSAFATPIFLAATRRTLSNPQKMWITMGDKKVRKSHSAINGSQIPSNEPFSLSGGLLMYPADSSLGVSFGEIVNCRCYAMYF